MSVSLLDTGLSKPTRLEGPASSVSMTGRQAVRCQVDRHIPDYDQTMIVEMGLAVYKFKDIVLRNDAMGQ